jgi:hypothetical protein
LFAAAACVGVYAGPPASQPLNAKASKAEGAHLGMPVQQVQSAGPCVQPCLYFEDFDDTLDFVAGTWIGNGLNGAAGGPFETWSATCSSNPANMTGLIEGHVETAHPHSGTQHVRISRDPGAITSFLGCVLDARVPASSVAGPNITPIGPQTSTAWLAFNDAGSGMNFQFQPQTPGNLMLVIRHLYFYYGFHYVYDYVGGGSVGYVFSGSWDLSGGYHPYSIHTDPCTRYRCLGGDNDTLACAGPPDCPGGECVGLIEFSDENGLLYTAYMWAGVVQDQVLFYGDNTGAAGPIGMDIDDVTIDRQDGPCPQVCGDNDVTGTEQCDGAIDTACPGRCVPPMGMGANGEAECECEIGPCSVTQDLPNGDSQAFDDQFGWFSFVADAPAYAVETCGTQDYDSALSVWVGTCDSLALAPGNHSAGIAYNDDCYGGPNFGDGSDPLASCFDGALALAFPYNACLCLDTTEGETYWIWDPRVSFGDETVISLTKRQACDNNDEFGSCCDPLGGCTNVAGPNDCTNGTYNSRKECDDVTCTPTEGACCDSFGDCTQTTEANCSGTFTLGMGCGDVTCTPTDGACCDRVTGACSETDAAGCTGNTVFSLGSHCSEVSCELATGACCDSATGDCSETTSVDCPPGSTLTWTKDTLCDDLDPPCAPPFIPTVSEWGLVITALLLLVGAKVYFGRREALA